MRGNEVVHLPFTLTNDYGDPIVGDLRFVEGFPGKPVVIVCHSFMAFKDWGFFPYVATKLAEAGFVAATFNFSLNGVGSDKKITDFDNFARNTFSRELHDLKVVTDALCNNAFGIGNTDSGRLSVLGHSRGGGIAIVFTALETRVRAVVTWSAISTFDRWSNHQKEKWRSLGFLPLAKDATISPLRLGIGLLQDFEQHRDTLDILAAAARLDRPWLIVHGREDVTVHAREAEALYGAADKTRSELLMLDHVGHLYNAASSDEDGYRTIDHILDLTTHWLQGQLY
ncbi:MAG TPA: dienelactone hydrolase family protein [Bacteroidota bacterium]|jgi:dienelactone hydrolase|nr:dienelactone hydrolase family protein [Bacteroidota bacterium]